MNDEKFVDVLIGILKVGVSGLVSNFETPAGRSPQPDVLRISHFYNGLDNAEKQVFKEALTQAARQSFNNLLCILDGSLAIDEPGEKGELELHYNDGTRRIRLNDPKQTPLNEIFRSYEW